MTTHHATTARTVALGMLSVVVPLLEAADTGGALRTVLAIAFHLTIPGVPLLALVRLSSPTLLLCAGGGLSIALTIISAQLMLWVDAWHPFLPVIIFAVVSLVALAGDGWRSRPRTAGVTPSRTG